MKELIDRINRISNDCHFLCMKFLGYYLPIAGNIGVFCQSDIEYKEFQALSNKLTKRSNNPNQKYFELIEPISVRSDRNLPPATYTFLYVRKPDSSSYGEYFGDVDFSMERDKYEVFKNDVINHRYPNGIEVYDRSNWDTVEMYSREIKSVGYISTQEFAEKVRVKFD